MTIFGINVAFLWENIWSIEFLYLLLVSIVIWYPVSWIIKSILRILWKIIFQIVSYIWEKLSSAIKFVWDIVTLRRWRIKKLSTTSPAKPASAPAKPKQKKYDNRPAHNPFIHGNPVVPEQLIGRDGELRRIAGRIITGQSTIITGSLGSGTTSVLQGLIVSPNEERAKTLYDDEINQLIFSYFDASTATEFDKTQFWESVLKPLEELIIAQETDTPLSKAYQTCQDNQFKTDELEKLIVQIKQTGWQLVLLIRGFDALLDNPILTKNQGDFFAHLRALLISPKNQGGTLVLVMTSSLSRSQLNNQTPKSSKGSPYFNINDEIVLGALPESKVDELLAQGKPYFTQKDCIFIKNIAGGHPYFLQVAASILWDNYKGGGKKSHKWQEELNEDFYNKVKDLLKKIWDTWDTSMQQTFTSVALKQDKSVKKAFSKKGKSAKQWIANLNRLVP